MALTNSVKEKISIEVIKTLKSKFDNFPQDASNNRNAPFHEAFLNAFSDKIGENVSNVPFFISLSSWLHGLNTTLGQAFFENVAHILCGGEKKEYTGGRGEDNILKMTASQKHAVSDIITKLSNGNIIPDLESENKQIFQNDNEKCVEPAMGFSADVFYEDDNSVVAIELKTVKPNKGGMQNEKQKILEGKAALYKKYPGKEIKFFIGFPFDPTVNTASENMTSYNKSRFFHNIVGIDKFFDSKETLVASELWDFLYGEENTMEEILSIINTISTTVFWDKFRLLTDGSKRNTQEYLDLLAEWNLFSEKEFLENKNNYTGRAQKAYNNSPFKADGKYDDNRYKILKEALWN